jgi:hypothetical protein
VQSSTAAQQAHTRNLHRGWWPMLPEWSQRVLKPVLSAGARRMGLISLPAEETMMFATSRSFPVKFLLRSYKCDETHRTRVAGGTTSPI